MSSISSVTSPTNLAQTASQNSFAQAAKNFQAIGTALQSGDITSAQNALTTFQKSLPGNSQSSSQASSQVNAQSSSQSTSNQPFGKNSQANSDYQSLTSALQSGNLSTAQQAYTSLQNDLKSSQSTTSASSTHKGHHHHHRSGGATSSTSSSTTSITAASSSSSTSSTSDSSDSTDSTVDSDGSLNVLA